MAATEAVPTTASVSLPHASASVRSARRRLAEDLSRRRVPRPTVDDSVLVLSEILSNALKHARPLESGRVDVAWDVRGEAVEIRVADGGGATRPYLQPPSLSSLGGRGLSIVATIAAEWGVREEDSGTVVWAMLPFERHVHSR